MISYLEQKSVLINKEIERFLPHRVDAEWMTENLGKTKLSPEICNEITKPIWDLLGRGGKRWRPVLMMLCCDAVDGGSKVMDFVPLVELIHNGTLIIDDIEDNSDMRRKGPAIHKKYGIDVAVNTGNMLYFLPHTILKKSDISKNLKLKIHELIAEEMLKLHLGQGMDIHWHNDGDGISETAYLQMCAFKTGVLARMAAKLGALFGNATAGQINSLGRFAEAVGIAFQIQDDILNLTGTLGKEFADDVTEGKRSIMVIHVLEKGTDADKSRLLEILSMKTTDIDLKQEAISIIKSYNSVLYAKKKAKQIVLDAWQKLDSVLKDSESKQKLKSFANFLIQRRI